MLQLVNDCSRFVTGYFEIISTSSLHIYRSALVLIPKGSRLRYLYESHARPLTRVVHGLPDTWGLNNTTTRRPFEIKLAVWSSCSRFLAISATETEPVEIFDPLTLQRLQGLEFPREISGHPMALIFSPDGRMLTCAGFCKLVRETFVVSWDLQTGGMVSGIKRQAPDKSLMLASHITYSMDGKVVGVLYRYRTADFISIYDVVFGVYMHDVDHGTPYHLFSSSRPRLYNIWTNGESFLFISLKQKTFTIWEVGLAPGAAPTTVNTVPSPIPEGPSPCDRDEAMNVQFHPAPYMLTITRPILLAYAFRVMDDTWDFVRVLEGGSDFYPTPTFSSDGRSFACSTTRSQVRLWSRSGDTSYRLPSYRLQETLPSLAGCSTPLLSPNGELIITFNGPIIQLRHTTRIPSLLPRFQTRTQEVKNFVLEFLPSRSFAVFSRQKDTKVTVLDLESGLPWSTIYTSEPVYGLGAAGSTVVVVNDKQVSTWDLLEQDSPLRYCSDERDSRWAELEPASRRLERKAIESSTREVIHTKTLAENGVVAASVSLDFRYVALIVGKGHEAQSLRVYSLSTGEETDTAMEGGTSLWFEPGGHDVWVGIGSGEKVWKISQDGTALGAHAGNIEDLEGSPWQSSLGYKVTSDGWILDADGRRLLMFPPSWQSEAVWRVWSGRFLALLHGTLPEAVILELGPQPTSQ